MTSANRSAMSPAREFARLRALQRLLRLYEVIYGPVCGISFLRRHVVEEMCRLAKLMPLLLALTVPAAGQQNHAQHHAHYQNWINQEGKGCCNDQDCGELAGDDERAKSDGTIEVKIEGEWCPVYAKHYLKKGNAPNWSTAHVCVTKKYSGNNQTACERLLCYQPKPGT
jgi:hypothetical protein